MVYADQPVMVVGVKGGREGDIDGRSGVYRASLVGRYASPAGNR